jgi:hypothetical protein
MKELEKVIKVDFEEVVDLDREGFLDLLSELVVGAVFPCLSNISYEIMEFERPRFIVLHVSGEIEEDSDSEFDVCDVCKKRIDDEQRCICDAGHIFCEEHLIHADDPDFEDEEDMDDVDCKFCPVCEAEEFERDLKRCSD